MEINVHVLIIFARSAAIEDCGMRSALCMAPVVCLWFASCEAAGGGCVCGAVVAVEAGKALKLWFGGWGDESMAIGLW